MNSVVKLRMARVAPFWRANWKHSYPAVSGSSGGGDFARNKSKGPGVSKRKRKIIEE